MAASDGPLVEAVCAQAVRRVVRNRLLTAAAAFAIVAVAALVFHHRLGQFIHGPATAAVIRMPQDPKWSGEAYVTITGLGITTTSFERISRTVDRRTDEVKHETVEGYYLLETGPKAYLLVRSSEAPADPITGMLHAIGDRSTDGKVLVGVNAQLGEDATLSPFILDANDPFGPLRFGIAIGAAVLVFGLWHLVLGLVRARTRGALAQLATIPSARYSALEVLSPDRVWAADDFAIASGRYRLDVVVFRDVKSAHARATERETSIGTEVKIEVEIAMRAGKTLAIEVGHEYHAHALLERIHERQPTAIAG